MRAFWRWLWIRLVCVACLAVCLSLGLVVYAADQTSGPRQPPAVHTIHHEGCVVTVTIERKAE